MSVTLAPGDFVIDYSGFRLDTAAKVADAKKSGAKGVIRYSAGAASDPHNGSYAKNKFKLITPAEHAALLADGFDIIANSEWYETRINEGYSAGHEDGLADLALWRSCGHAKGSSIYVSLDTGVPSNIAGIISYLHGHNTALGGYYFSDCYGGTPLLRQLLSQHIIKYGWRPNAGDWSHDGLPYQPGNPKSLLSTALAKTPARIWQTGNYWFSNQADENLILRTPVGSHYDAIRAAQKPPAPHPTPAPTPATTTIPNGLIMRDDTKNWSVKYDAATKLMHVFHDGKWLRTFH